MKLTIERLTVLSPQDKLDLAKIWPAVDVDALHQQLTGSNALFVARFNNRLLGAVWVEIDAAWGEGRLLVGQRVRPETRRRDVGLYLLDGNLSPDARYHLCGSSAINNHWRIPP